MTDYVEPGSVILYRTYFGSTLMTVSPVRVVRHDDDGLLTWTASGTPRWLRADPAGRALRDVPRAQWPAEFTEGAWFGAGVLVLSRPGVDHSVWWFSDDTGGFAGWYVNLERNVLWTDGDTVGIDAVDQELDGWVTPDRTWHWKDEESFADKTGDPAFWSADEAAAVRAEGERVRALATAGAAPFDGTWCDFRPDPSWALPARPSGGLDRPPALPLTGC
ncbi:MAG TPA: DUF402 domain-containing protein [Actinocatenispora sp.]